jgi:8-oxo-dGTP pyrophosphatase MutT (NUDIX family)
MGWVLPRRPATMERMSQPADRPATTPATGAEIAGVTMTDTPPPAIPAATVILLRDDPEGMRVLMLKRTGGGAFGGFWVFPGGRVDATDADELAAAVREAKEESDLDLDPAGFVRFSHWTPPAAEMRRFSTWFFVAEAPHEDHQTVVVDQGEIVNHDWLLITEALAQRDRGEIELAPPTFVTLAVLAQSATVADALAAARAKEPTIYEVHLEKLEKRAFTVFNGDVGYNDAALLEVDGPRHRLELTTNPWVYENTL